MKRYAYIIWTAFALCALMAGHAFSAEILDGRIFFNDWAPGESLSKEASVYATWAAPSKAGVVRYTKSSNDVDVYKLTYAPRGREEFTIGLGLGGVDARWVTTDGGEFLLIDRRVDNNKNEILILRPISATELSLVFRTPAWPASGDKAVGNCRWEIGQVDPKNGTIGLAVSWTFTNASNSVNAKGNLSRKFQIPLYYSMGAMAR
ncbi:MAG: hypothetical protein NTV51_12315 [Verrucomicrobia bacterium]|nr:hypothetical protein [Verrucomicrobiota bacterium]